MSEAGTLLRRGIDTLKLAVPPDFEQRARDYLTLLTKWNRVYSLTAVRDLSKLVSHHLLDSLAVVPHLEGSTLLDVGSGPGLPGIPIALARPALSVTLLDSNQKKAAFMSQVVAELGIGNASVRRERVESWQPAAKYDVVISRAFADLSDFVKLARHLMNPDGRLLAMKGLYPHEELAQLPSGFVCERVLTLDVPEVAGKRHLVVIRHAS